MPNFRGSFTENGHHRATQTPMACIRWVGHGITLLYARGVVLVRRLGTAWGTTVRRQRGSSATRRLG
jgi:hypothetical protein